MFDMRNVYRNPLTIEWFDSYFYHEENVTIINSMATLTYIPDEFQRVVIKGYFENRNVPPSTSLEYTVNYTNGTIQFHKSVADNTVLPLTYYARGIINYPAVRIKMTNENSQFSADNVEDAFDELLSRATLFESRDNSTVIENKAVVLDTDTRSTVLTSKDGIVTKVEEKDGSKVIKTTTLTYNSDGSVNYFTVSADGKNVKYILNYSNGQVVGVSKQII
ncbi:hypothetical protein CHH83_02755 [Bacillus sp. 7586-K]|nr:hypothetical protein CHH83_02755 [Bacillus sp. 7586-K]